MTSHIIPAFAAAVLLLTALGGCADTSTPGGPASLMGPDAPPPAIAAAGEVIGIGLVLQHEEEDPQLCLGAVAESSPPQCGGQRLPMSGWDWAAVDGDENANGVTFGTYAVQGTWDGILFTVTAPPIMLALYDPIATVDPREDPANAGTTDEAELLEIQAELPEAVEVLTSYPSNGYLFVDVVYDDGQIQRYVDETYGADVVAVRSSLRDVQ